MARNGKKNSKKVVYVHASPKESHIVKRNRRKAIKREKRNYNRNLQKLKRELKENKNSKKEARNQEYLQLVASYEESVVQENINQPSSSSTEPSTSRSQEKPATQGKHIKERKIINQIQFCRKESTASSNKGQEENNKNDFSKGSKKPKKGRNPLKTSVPSNPRNEAAIQEYLQHYTKVEETEVQVDINLPQYSSTKSIASSHPLKHTTQGNDTKGRKNIDQTYSSDNEPSTSRPIKQQVNKKNDSRKASKKAEKDRGPTNDESLTKPKPPVLKSPKNIAESENPCGNIADIVQKFSQSIPLQDDIIDTLYEGKQEIKLMEAENWKSQEKEYSKPIKSKALPSNTSNYIPPKPHRKAAVDSTNQKDILPEKPRELDTTIKSSDGVEKIILSIDEMKPIAIKGNIKVLDTNNSDKKCDEKGLYIDYNSNGNVILIGDENIQMSISVKEGSQVICNSRRRSDVHLVQNVASCSGIMERQSPARPEEKTKIGAEHIVEASCETSSVSKHSTRSCQTVDGKSTGNSCTNALIDFGYPDEAATNTKCDLNCVDEVSEENEPSSNNSVLETLQKESKVFLKNSVSLFGNLLTLSRSRSRYNWLKSYNM